MAAFDLGGILVTIVLILLIVFLWQQTRAGGSAI